MSFDERQPDANYRQMCVKLTAERDALKAEAIDAEYHRGRLAAQIKELSAQLEDSQAHVMCGLDVAVLSAQLTELREAAEEFLMSINITWDGWNQQRVKVFRAALNKPTP